MCRVRLLEVEFMDTQAVEDLLTMSPADAARAPITAANRRRLPKSSSPARSLHRVRLGARRRQGAATA